MDNNKTNTVVIISLLIVAFLYFNPGLNPLEKDKDIIQQEVNEAGLTSWQESYMSKATTNLQSYEVDKSNTDYYDINDPLIESVAKGISTTSASSYEAIQNSLKYVYDNIEYIYGEADNACFDKTAPQILAGGKGQCDTQSIVLISLLRNMGIAAKPVGGCIVVNTNCKLQSVLLNAIGTIPGEPRFSSIESVDTESESFSRGYSRKGGLHAWVTAWDENKGWVNLEVTAGEIADTSCYFYHVELFPEDSNKEDICISKSWHYAKGCQTNNFDLLDQYGLGTEVIP